MQEKKDKIKEIVLALSFMSFISSSLIGSMALGYFAGKWLEGYFDIYPTGRIVGIVLGTAIAVWTIAKHIKAKFIDGDKGNV